MADNKGGSDLDVFEGLAKKSGRPTTPGLAPPAAPQRGRTLLGGMSGAPVPPPPGGAPLPPPSLPKPPGSMGPLPPVAPPPPSKLGAAFPPPQSAPPPPPMPPPQSLASAGPPAPLPPPIPPPAASIGSQLGLEKPRRAGPAVDMDWDDEEESTHVYDKHTDGMPVPTGGQPRPAAGSPAASKVSAAASLLAASGSAAKPSMQSVPAQPPLPQMPPMPTAPPMPTPPPHVQAQAPSRSLDEPTAIRPRPVAPQQQSSKAGIVLGGLALVVVLALAAFILVPRKGELNIDVKSKSGGPVAKAEIFVDGQKRCDTAPCVVKDLAPGSVSIKVLGDFAVAEQVGQVEAGKEKTILILVEAAGKSADPPTTAVSATQAGIKIGGAQDGIKVFVDGTEKGSLPLELKDLTPGTHKIRLDGGDRYEKIERSVEISAGEIKDLGPLKLKVLKGQISLELATPGATVSIVGEKSKKIDITDKQWKSSPVKLDLDPNDTYKLVATKKGFDDLKQDLSFEDGQALKSVRIELFEAGKAPTGVSGSITTPNPTTTTPNPTTTTPTPTPTASASASAAVTANPSAGGTLNINSIPVSKVVLDGRPLGSTPKVGVSVTPGSHTVTFIHPDKGRKSVTVNVKPGQTATAAVKF